MLDKMLADGAFSHSKHTLTNLGRFSTAVTADDDEMDEENTFEDWTKTTHEKDTWAARERRRTSKFAKIDSDVALQQYERERSRSGRRASSAIGLFTQGVDSHGNAIILSDDKYEEFELPIEHDKDGKKLLSPNVTTVFGEERRMSLTSQNSDKRRGSILSLWRPGKDKDGKDHLHSGHEGDDWVEAVEAVSNGSATPPASPNLNAMRADRRGSILSIWRQGKDREGRLVMHSGEELDAIVTPLDEHGKPVAPEKKKVEEVPERERVGSILSIWSQGKDKDGKTVIHSGEEHDGVIEIPVPQKVESPKMRGKERRGSVLSMWSEDRRDTQDRPAPVVLKVHEEDEEKV